MENYYANDEMIGYMNMKKKLANCIEFAQWMVALAIAMLVCNMFTFVFYHPAIEVKTDNAATPGKMTPNAWCIYGNEGWGIEYIDQNGYVNENKPLEDKYILAVGSSQTEGFHTPVGQRWSDLLNQKLATNDKLKVYNIGHSGYFFPQMAKHFQAMCKEFPEMETIVMEISDTKFALEDLQSAVTQVDFDENQKMDKIYANMSQKQKLKRKLKENVPLLRWLHLQYETMKNRQHDSVAETVEYIDLEEYGKLLESVLHMMRETFDGNVIIAYHPSVIIQSNGDMKIVEKETDLLFAEKCKENGITFINCSNAFKQRYEQDYAVPIGFWNTTMGEGHINSVGHAIIADEVYKEIIIE